MRAEEVARMLFKYEIPRYSRKSNTINHSLAGKTDTNLVIKPFIDKVISKEDRLSRV